MGKACPAKARELEELAKSEHGQRCVFVLVSVDGGADAAREFARAHSIEKCIVASAVDEDTPSDLFNVSGLPHCSIIDCNGILARNYEVNLPADIDACFEPSTLANNITTAPVSEVSK